MNPEEMDAAADLIELVLAAYLTAHPGTDPRRVSAATLLRWVRNTANQAAKKGSN